MSAGSIKWRAFVEFLNTCSASWVPFKLLAQLTTIAASAFFKIFIWSSELIRSGPKSILSPTSLTITFTLEPFSFRNSNAVVRPCLPFAIIRLVLSPNLENVCLSMIDPISSATVNNVTFPPSFAMQYAIFTAFPPIMSTDGTSRTLPPPNFPLSVKALHKCSFDFNLIIRSTKKSGITTTEFI